MAGTCNESTMLIIHVFFLLQIISATLPKQSRMTSRQEQQLLCPMRRKRWLKTSRRCKQDLKHSAVKTVNQDFSTPIESPSSKARFILPANANAMVILTSQLYFCSECFAAVEHTVANCLLRICDVKIRIAFAFAGSMNCLYDIT